MIRKQQATCTQTRRDVRFKVRNDGVLVISAVFEQHLYHAGGPRLVQSDEVRQLSCDGFTQRREVPSGK